jgi:hypothetical protein
VCHYEKVTVPVPAVIVRIVSLPSVVDVLVSPAPSETFNRAENLMMITPLPPFPVASVVWHPPPPPPVF